MQQSTSHVAVFLTNELLKSNQRIVQIPPTRDSPSNCVYLDTKKMKKKSKMKTKNDFFI